MSLGKWFEQAAKEREEEEVLDVELVKKVEKFVAKDAQRANRPEVSEDVEIWTKSKESK